jgi:RNA polymerase-binding transcription factor DksA
MTIDLQQTKKRLQDEQLRLREHIAGLTEARPTPVDAERTHQGPYEFEEAALDLLEMERERAILVSEQALLTEVEDALKRIGEGTYGRCIIDGEPILEKRLEAIPWTPYCVKHEQQVEQSNLSG